MLTIEIQGVSVKQIILDLLLRNILDIKKVTKTIVVSIK